MTDPENRPFGLWGSVRIALLCVLFGANPVALKITFTGFGVLFSAALRFLLAGILISAWAMITGRSFRLRQGQWRPVLVFSSLFTVQLALFNIGLDRTFASRGALLTNILPFLIMVLAHFFLKGDPMTKQKVLGLLLGFLGVMFVVSDQASFSGRVRSGDLIVLLATAIWAANTVYIKRVISSFEAFHIALYPMLFSIPFLFLGSWLSGEDFVTSPTNAAVLALVYQTLITGSFGFLVWNTLLKRHGAVAMHSFVFIMPISAVAFAAVLLGDPIGPNIIAALVLIVAGIIVMHWRSGTARAEVPIEVYHAKGESSG